MFTVHATQKLRDRVKPPLHDPVPEATTVLGNWYATALLWKPQVALLVNERTLFPVFMPLAPAGTLISRFPEALREVLVAHEVPRLFVDMEIAEMAHGVYAKTASRSRVGMLVEFGFLAEARRSRRSVDDLVGLSLELADTPCSPLYKSHTFPDQELDAAVDEWMATI